jgi:hypothetical protein
MPKTKKKQDPEKKKPSKKEETTEDSDWDEEWEAEEDFVDEDETDDKNTTLTKLKDLRYGMTDVNVEAVVDFVGPVYGKEYGEKPYAISFIKDETGEVKITFWADDIKKAKKGKKVRIMHANVTLYKLQPQLNPNRKYGVEFL